MIRQTESAGNSMVMRIVFGFAASVVAVVVSKVLLVSVVTLGTGRTSMTQGAVQVVLFATHPFLACVP